jgi:hypothetical protein
MSQSIPDKLDVNRTYKSALGLKAEKTVHRVTFNPSTANPGETLYVNVPRLSQNVVMVPGSFGLLFDLSLAAVSDADKADTGRLVVNNLGRNLVVRKRVAYGGETLSDTNRFDLFQTYSDLFTTKIERDNMLREGVSSKIIRQIRIGITDPTDADEKDKKLAAVYGKRYRIPIDHPILDSHGVLYPRQLSNTLTFEITLPESSKIAVHTADKPRNYSLTNMELEYECISSDYLARDATSSYEIGKGFYYENVLLHKTFSINDVTDTVINEHVNIPRKSMTGILLLFTKAYVTGARDTEAFVNPNITKVDINVDGMPNKLYSKGMIPSDFWTSITNKMGLTDNITQKDFYNDKFALWIDMRTYPDDSIHGNGLVLNNTKDGVKIEIRRTAGSDAAATTTCHMFVVADAMAEFENSDLLSILY